MNKGSRYIHTVTCLAVFLRVAPSEQLWRRRAFRGTLLKIYSAPTRLLYTAWAFRCCGSGGGTPSNIFFFLILFLFSHLHFCFFRAMPAIYSRDRPLRFHSRGSRFVRASYSIPLPGSSHYVSFSFLVNTRAATVAPARCISTPSRRSRPCLAAVLFDGSADATCMTSRGLNFGLPRSEIEKRSARPFQFRRPDGLVCFFRTKVAPFPTTHARSF